jgi:hypothetical protein
MRSLMVVVLALPIIAAAGCGGGSSEKTTAASSATPQGDKAGGAPPAELLGTYATTLKLADVPASAPPELKSQRAWLMKITKDGGPGNAPSLAIIRPPSDALEAARLSVSADTLTLSREECAPSDPGGEYTFVTSAYRWRLDGTSLRLTTLKNGCPDKVAETILTSHPWKKRS